MEKQLNPLHDLKKPTVDLSALLDESMPSDQTHTSSAHEAKKLNTQSPTETSKSHTNTIAIQQNQQTQSIAASTSKSSNIKKPAAPDEHSQLHALEQESVSTQAVVDDSAFILSTSSAASYQDRSNQKKVRTNVNTVGVSQYQWSKIQWLDLFSWSFIVTVLGAIMGTLLMILIVIRIWKNKRYSVVLTYQYRDLGMIVAASWLLAFLLFISLFFMFEFFRVTLSGYYILGLLPTLFAQMVLLYAKAAECNYQQDFHSKR